MNKSYRVPPYSFAEIMIAAPWATSIVQGIHDNGKAGLLHRNSGFDERSEMPDGFDALALEHEARATRARYLGAAFRKGVLAVRTWLRGLSQPRIAKA